MKKFISIIAMFILSITLLSVPVQAEVDKEELTDTLSSHNLVLIEKTTLYEYNIIDRAKNKMGSDYEILLFGSDIYDDVFIYIFVPKNNDILDISLEAYAGIGYAKDFWDEFTDVFRELSVYVQLHASTLNEDNKYAVMLLNPEDYNYFMWMAFDGKVIYDYVNGIDDTYVLFK